MQYLRQSSVSSHTRNWHTYGDAMQFADDIHIWRGISSSGPAAIGGSAQMVCAAMIVLTKLHSAYSESVSWVAWPIGDASRPSRHFVCGFCGGNGNELRGLRAKFWWRPKLSCETVFARVPTHHSVSIVRLRAFLWHKTVLPPSRGSIRCIIAEKHWQCHFSRKPEVEIWRKHAKSTFRTRHPIRLLYQWLIDWLVFNGTFSTVRLYRAFRSTYSLRFGK